MPFNKVLCPKCQGNNEHCAFCDGGWVSPRGDPTTKVTLPRSAKSMIVFNPKEKLIGFRPSSRRIIFHQDPVPPYGNLSFGLLSLAKLEIEQIERARIGIATEGKTGSYLQVADNAIRIIKELIKNCSDKQTKLGLQKMLKRAKHGRQKMLKTAYFHRVQSAKLEKKLMIIALAGAIDSSNKAIQTKAKKKPLRKVADSPATLMSIRFREVGFNKNAEQSVAAERPGKRGAPTLGGAVGKKSATTAVTAIGKIDKSGAPKIYFREWVLAKGIDFSKLSLKTREGAGKVEKLRQDWIKETGLREDGLPK